MKSIAIALAGTLFLLAPAYTLADHGRQHKDRHTANHEEVAGHHYREARRHMRQAHRHERKAERALREQRARLGRVVAVEPIYHYHGSADGRGRCYQRHGPQARSAGWAPTVIGGVAGSALGYGLGHHRLDPQLATITGAVLGAAVGHELGERALKAHRDRSARPCTACRDGRYRSEPAGYLVTYRYNGQLYHRQMDRAPGQWVALAG